DARVVRRAMYESDVLLAPSITALNGDQEGIPVVLMEAMATGMLVVSTRHSGIPELVSDGESGFLVNPRDVLGLAQCLKRIWRNPPLWRRFGEAGRRRVERDYNAETQHRILLELYGDLVAERRISLSVATGAAPREDSKLHGPRPQAKAPQRSGNLKICFFLSEFPVVSETFILNQITGLMDLGHRVDLLAIARKDDNVFHPSVLEYKLMDRVEYLPSPGRTYYSRACRGIERLLRLSASDPAAARRMVKLLRSPFDAHRVVDCLLLAQKIAVLNDYDVVHCHFATSGAVLAPWKAFSRFRTPFLTSFHGYDVNLHEYRLRPGFYRTLFEQGDAFSANTRFTAQRAQELGCPPERTFILPMSIDTRHAVFRERHIAPGESTRILTVPIEYVLVGDGRLRGQLEQLVDDLGIRRAVRFTGYLSDLELDKEYDKSHIFLLPSVTASNGDMEGQALVLQEAQARGIPVVSTRHNGIPEGVAEGKSAILVPERDHFALARTIESLIEDHDCWPAMGRAGRQLVEECFKQELLIKSLESLYRRIIASTIPDSGRPSDVPGVGEGHHA
ncbi:MAG: glycosyltransferase, partial [Acidobacteriota bacterium]